MPYAFTPHPHIYTHYNATTKRHTYIHTYIDTADRRPKITKTRLKRDVSALGPHGIDIPHRLFFSLSGLFLSFFLSFYCIHCLTGSSFSPSLFVLASRWPLIHLDHTRTRKPLCCSVASMDVRLCFRHVHPLLVLSALAALPPGTWRPAAAGKSCGDTRQVYAEKGYSTNTAPLTQISGRTVRLVVHQDIILDLMDLYAFIHSFILFVMLMIMYM